MVQSQGWREIAKRTAALGFAAAYMHKHSLDRAASLRVAYLAYRFLDGHDVTAINAAADLENETRVEKEHPPRTFAWLRYNYGKKK